MRKFPRKSCIFCSSMRKLPRKSSIWVLFCTSSLGFSISSSQIPQEFQRFQLFLTSDLLHVREAKQQQKRKKEKERERERENEKEPGEKKCGVWGRPAGKRPHTGAPFSQQWEGANALRRSTETSAKAKGLDMRGSTLSLQEAPPAESLLRAAGYRVPRYVPWLRQKYTKKIHKEQQQQQKRARGCECVLLTWSLSLMQERERERKKTQSAIDDNDDET